jgi:hypothetical protein
VLLRGVYSRRMVCLVSALKRDDMALDRSETMQ